IAEKIAAAEKRRAPGGSSTRLRRRAAAKRIGRSLDCGRDGAGVGSGHVPTMTRHDMSTATASTFEVSDVERATRPLPEVPYKQAVEALLTTGLAEHERRMIERMRGRFTIALPEPPPSRPIEACARYHGRLLADVPFHPVVAAAHRSFMDHRPLRLSPDAIWLMICQAVANHVHAPAEELRARLVRHEGRARIDVRRDDFVKGSPENPWPEVFAEFSAGVRDHVGPAIDLFLPAFSTTGPAERAAAEVVLLDAVRSYFQY